MLNFCSFSPLPEGRYKFSTLWGGYVSGSTQKLQVRTMVFACAPAHVCLMICTIHYVDDACPCAIMYVQEMHYLMNDIDACSIFTMYIILQKMYCRCSFVTTPILYWILQGSSSLGGWCLPSRKPKREVYRNASLIPRLLPVFQCYLKSWNWAWGQGYGTACTIARLNLPSSWKIYVSLLLSVL